MLPIALGQGPGAAGRASMAKVIIGCDMLCLLLSLLVTPVSYAIFDDWVAAGCFLRLGTPAPSLGFAGNRKPCWRLTGFHSNDTVAVETRMPTAHLMKPLLTLKVAPWP